MSMVYELLEVSFLYQVKRVTSWGAFYHTSIPYKLGCILPYKQAIVVSQTWGSVAAVAGSVHETSRKRWYVPSWLRCTQGLGILLWCCCKTTYCTPRNHYGSTWDTPRVYASKAMQSRRETKLYCFWRIGQYSRSCHRKWNGGRSRRRVWRK